MMDEKRRKRKRRRIRQTVGAWFTVAAVVFALMAAVVGILRFIGKERLLASAGNTAPTMTTDETIDSIDDIMNRQTKEGLWQEGWLQYEGRIYEYNDDIMTFLIMGIDKKGEVENSRDATEGGQADALFLVVADRGKKEIRLVGINRDTMVDINAYGAYGEGTDGSAKAQIAVQHGFGDGKELSCELTRDAVSELFYNLPIHGYAAVNMDAIPVINDAVGGVTLEVLEDIDTDKYGRSIGKIWHEGEEIHLQGMEAYYYVRWRDRERFESARLRLARQKQYLEAFLERARSETKKNIMLPVRLYGDLSKYMVTDISIDETAYLAGELIGYTMDPRGIYTLSGETVKGDAYEEFYPDEEALRALMIAVFYREVEDVK